MIRLRCSGNPPDDLDLSGTKSDLTELRDVILRFCKRKRPLLEVPVDQTLDPAPYERRLSGLRFVRSAGKLRIVVNEDRILISGTLELLELFADKLPLEADRSPQRVQFNAFEGEGAVEPDSLGIVLTLTS